MHIMLDDAQIAVAIRSFAAASGQSVTYAAKRATGSADTVARIDSGTSLTLRRATRIVQWLSDHWPADLPWPDGIDRPAPTPGSPAAARSWAAP